MRKIKTALISVSDKKNLKPLLNSLKKNNIKIISSGGTYNEIKKLKFKCIEVSEFTNSPEILEGRVKTLHPKIHAGILNRRKSNSVDIKFDIRFHLEPSSKVMKTQDNKSILIELENEGWKFSCDNFDINIDNGLYLGNKNLYKDNQNICISGISKDESQIIKWEITKI